MARKFSLAYLTIPGTDPVTQIKIAKETGYDFVSLRTIPMHLPGEPEFLPQKDKKLFADIQNALKAKGWSDEETAERYQKICRKLKELREAKV